MNKGTPRGGVVNPPFFYGTFFKKKSMQGECRTFSSSVIPSTSLIYLYDISNLKIMQCTFYTNMQIYSNKDIWIYWLTPLNHRIILSTWEANNQTSLKNIIYSLFIMTILKTAPHFVYIINEPLQNRKFTCKIGFSKNVDQRLSLIHIWRCRRRG